MTDLQDLHDRATRGLPLSDEERVQLNAWYAHEDEVETRLLAASIKNGNTEVLQLQIRTALVQVAAVTHQIQQLVAQNEELRREVITLKDILVQRMPEPVL